MGDKEPIENRLADFIIQHLQKQDRVGDYGNFVDLAEAVLNFLEGDRF